MTLRKFPRTSHIQGSKFQHGDGDLDAVPFSEIEGKHLIVEEKMDGANFGISFEGGEMFLQSRGHFLRGGPREKQFEILKQWAATHDMSLYEILGDRYVCYGECMVACHTIWYDQLPHYFMEFDVLDRETGMFLSTTARDLLLRSSRANVEIVPVRVLAAGVVGSTKEFESMIGQSAFISENAKQSFLWSVTDAYNLQHRNGDSSHDVLERLSDKYYTGRTMEGLYVKWEEAGEVKGRYKFVRGDFTSHVAGQEEHWHDRPILQNQLVEGGIVRMFSIK